MIGQAMGQEKVNDVLKSELAKLIASMDEVAIETSSEISEVETDPVEEMTEDVDTTEVERETSVAAETMEKIVEEVATQEDVDGKEEIENPEILDTAAEISGDESEDVETPEVKEKDTKGEELEKSGEAEQKGVEASKIEDVVEEEIPAASEENTEPEGEEKVPQDENEKEGGDKKPQIAGVKLIDKHIAEIAVDKIRKCKLRVRAVLKKTENRREYQVYEVDSEGNDLATIGSVNTFTASQVRKENARLRETIENFQGDYTEQLSDIIVKIKMIEMKRVLMHTQVNDSDNCISVEEYVEKLGRWFLENINDVRVGVYKIKGTHHIMLVRRGEKTISQIFKSVNKEISEKLDSNYIKGELYRKKLLNCDKNTKCVDTQFTISKDAQERLGSIRDKVMSFVLPDEIAKEIVKRYEEERFTVAIESTEGE